jgi:hypothetical protein
MTDLLLPSEYLGLDDGEQHNAWPPDLWERLRQAMQDCSPGSLGAAFRAGGALSLLPPGGSSKRVAFPPLLRRLGDGEYLLGRDTNVSAPGGDLEALEKAFWRLAGRAVAPEVPPEMATARGIEEYQLLERVGAGGMAEVYKARGSMGRVVALKVMHAHLAGDPGFRARFRREAGLLTRLDHPNIVRAYEYGDGEGGCYLAMQFVEGQTLEELMEERRLSWDETARIVGDVAGALDYAHAQGAIHRDVKPGNILLAGDGAAMLTDFGLARLRGGAGITALGAIVGTPSYMAPEQATGDQVDARADIYSLGVVAYELLAGRAPFEGDTPAERLLSRMCVSPTPPRQLAPEIPPDAERVLLRALARQPDDRYESAGEFAADLRLALQQPPAQAGGVPAGLQLPARPTGDGVYLVETRSLWAAAPRDTGGAISIGGVVVPAGRWREAANIFCQIGGQARLCITPPANEDGGEVVVELQGGNLDGLRVAFAGLRQQPAEQVELVEAGP